jgi:transposase
MSAPMRSTKTNQLIEVRAERLEAAPVGERQRWSDDFKDRAITASLDPGTNISALARSLDITPLQLFAWRRAPALRAEKIEPQAPAEPGAVKTRRVEIEIGGAVVPRAHHITLKIIWSESARPPEAPRSRGQVVLLSQ